MVAEITVKGLVEVRHNMNQLARDIHGNEMVDAIQESALLVLTDAKIGAPVDTGRLRNSITAEVTTTRDKIIGTVGSNVEYAPFIELGTKAHFPPLAALRLWAKRHGINPFLVARAIATRGIKGRKFLQGAFDKNKVAIQAKLNSAVEFIVRKANG